MSKKTPPLEIEIKLYISPKSMVLLRSDVQIEEYAITAWQCKELLNRYYDTPDRALTRTKSVLRIRTDGNEYIQTLKSSGKGLAGLSQRDELDWVLDKDELDLALLDTQNWPDNLAQVDKTQLSVIFTTDFIREFILVNWLQGAQLATIEVALDNGLVKSGHAEKAICELELELKAGEADTLLDFALVLAARYPMMPSISSKAATGYRLADSHRFLFKVAELPNTQQCRVLIHHHLFVAQQLLEHYQWQADDTIWGQWLDQLELLKEQLMRAGCRALVQQLTCIVDDWQPIRHDLHKADALFNNELSNVRWGVFSLSVARWLLHNRE